LANEYFRLTVSKTPTKATVPDAAPSASTVDVSDDIRLPASTSPGTTTTDDVVDAEDGDGDVASEARHNLRLLKSTSSVAKLLPNANFTYKRIKRSVELGSRYYKNCTMFYMSNSKFNAH
jgi:hypothetical protein